MARKNARILTLSIAAALSFAGALCGPAGTAAAKPKPNVFFWWDSHYHNLDFEPYLQHGKDPQTQQWEGEAWNPSDWSKQRGSSIAVIKRFYTADIIREQYVENGVPVLVVGPSFYRLGGYDQGRVAAMIDDAYKITRKTKDGIFRLYDWDTRKPVGAYSKYGLSLQ